MAIITIKQVAPVSVVYVDSTLILPGEIKKPDVINAMTLSLSNLPNGIMYIGNPQSLLLSVPHIKIILKHRKHSSKNCRRRFKGWKLMNMLTTSSSVLKLTLTWAGVGIFTS
jgi:hypothetical protein